MATAELIADAKGKGPKRGKRSRRGAGEPIRSGGRVLGGAATQTRNGGFGGRLQPVAGHGIGHRTQACCMGAPGPASGDVALARQG